MLISLDAPVEVILDVYDTFYDTLLVLGGLWWTLENLKFLFQCSSLDRIGQKREISDYRIPTMKSLYK